ncbi:MAG: deoxynucleoside kinase, partial [Sporichthyaceae bacterium]|nr:deoxynucleoside kinase [Sporichthyaceae bacterium]
VVSDWSMLKGPVFAALTLERDDAARMASTCGIWSTGQPRPDLVIYLRASTSTLRQRIAARGRSMESKITEAYLRRLATEYERAIRVCEIPILQVDADAFDVFHPEDLDGLVYAIDRRLRTAGRRRV